jgi:hypothetical protein
MIEGLRTTEDNDKIIPLLQHLSGEYDNMFDHQDQSKNFIEQTLKFFVRR